MTPGGHHQKTNDLLNLNNFSTTSLILDLKVPLDRVLQDLCHHTNYILNLNNISTRCIFFYLKVSLDMVYQDQHFCLGVNPLDRGDF